MACAEGVGVLGNLSVQFERTRRARQQVQSQASFFRQAFAERVFKMELVSEQIYFLQTVFIDQVSIEEKSHSGSCDRKNDKLAVLPYK